MFYAVVLAGGSGVRFWPKSRRQTPKQLLNLFGSSSLIKQTTERLEPLFPKERLFVVTHADQIEAIQRHVELPSKNIIAEPLAKNTAAAVGLAALTLLKLAGEEAVFAVLPSDHHIGEPDAYLAALALAKDVALKNYLVTIGIRPRYPETGYGYIEMGQALTEGVYKVKRFVEKPDLSTATQFVAEGRYFWNAGIFVWKVKTLLAALKKHLPALYEGLKRIEPALGTPEETTTVARVYEALPAISVDYGIMEKADNAAVVLGDFSWSDVGNWSSLAEISEKDELGNVKRGEVIALDCANSIFYGDNGLIAAIGLKDFIVVSSGNAVLICPKDKAQRVRQVIEALKQLGKKEYL